MMIFTRGACERFLVMGALAALAGCVVPAAPPMAAASPMVAKCGPAPTRSMGLGSAGSVLALITGGGETAAEFQQRQALYGLCEHDDPAYPAMLGEALRANAERDAVTEAARAERANAMIQSQAIQSQMQAQQGQDFEMQSQANFWAGLGAMNAGPR